MSLPNASDSGPQSSAYSINPPAIASASGTASFIERRSAAGNHSGRPERRQFGSSHYGLSEEGRELALAIDQYKVQHHRRYLTCDEMLRVLSKLGYAKQS